MAMEATGRSTDVILDSDGQLGFPSGKIFLSRVKPVLLPDLLIRANLDDRPTFHRLL